MQSLIYQTVKTRSGQAGYIKLGSGDPLIMVIGYSGTLFHWNQFFINELANNFTVYLIDNRKVGLSDSTNEESIHGFATDIVEFIQSMNLNNPIIFGWSMGGAIVQELVKSYPSIPKQIIIMSSVPQIPYTNPDFSKFLSDAGSYSAADFKNKLYWFFFSEMNPDIKSYLIDSALVISNYHYRFTNIARDLQDYAVPNWSGMSIADLNDLKIPVLILWAKNDVVVGFDAISLLLNNIKDAKLVAYPNGGHFLMHLHSKKMALDIVNFCKHQ